MGATGTHLQGGQFYGRVARRREVSGFVLSEVVHQVPRAFPRHAHERTYINLLLGGAYAEEIGHRPVTHGPLSVTVRPAGIEHLDRVGPRGGRFFMVELGSGWLDLVQGGTNHLAAPASLAGPEAMWAMVKLYREFREWDLCSADVAESLTAALADCAANQSAGERTSRPSWLARAAEMVTDGFRESVSLANLAREVGVHPAYLSRVFRRQFGRSPAELTRALRVRAVCETIGDSRRTLADIAFGSGFADQAHMTRVVTRYLGMTPGRLRSLLHDP